MAIVTIHQSSDSIRVQRLPRTGPSFLIVYVGSDVSIILHGYDQDAVANARAMAAALTDAADEFDHHLRAAMYERLTDAAGA